MVDGTVSEETARPSVQHKHDFGCSGRGVSRPPREEKSDVGQHIRDQSVVRFLGGLRCAYGVERVREFLEGFELRRPPTFSYSSE